jgi:hypothetical protein
MSQIFAPSGFQPRFHPSGGANPRWKVGNIQPTPTNTLRKGMPITFDANGYIQPAINFATTPDVPLPVRGVFWGIQYADETGSVKERPFILAGQPTFNSAVSGTNNGNVYNSYLYPYIYQDVDMEYYVQANGPITRDMIGKSFDLDVTTYPNSTYSGSSAIALDATPVEGFAGNWILSELAEINDNQWGDPYTVVLVKMNTAVTTNY